jgi:two-component system CheB/CheR fusion protein
MDDGGHLRLRKTTEGNRERTPVDIFFTSLAENLRENSAGVILSVGGSDGSHGIMSLKEHGGLTIAQGSDGTQAAFKDMPNSAVATGLIDVVLPVQDIPARLVDYVRSMNDLPALEASSSGVREIYALLRTQLGHDFSEYKTNTFTRRMWRRMQTLQLTSIDAYRQRLESDPAEARLLFRELLIRVTDFFRDPDAFAILEEQVIPKLFEGKGADADVRVWVPACATGEEAYSIAILLRERMDKLTHLPKVQIFATDIDDQSMRFARAGHYAASALRNLSPERLLRYFENDGDDYRLKKEIRDLCIFSPHSLTRDPPFSRLDLISCRNLLIYLQPDLQSRAMQIFHYALRPGGFLFLGMAENASRSDDLFAPLDKANRIFQRLDRGRTSLSHLRYDDARLSSAERGRRAHPRSNLLDTATARVASAYSPAYVIVSRTGEIHEHFD